MTDNNDDRPEVDKCGDRDCFVCYPPVEDDRRRVAIAGFGELKLEGTGKVSVDASLESRGNIAESEA